MLISRKLPHYTIISKYNNNVSTCNVCVADHVLVNNTLYNSK